MITRYTKFNPDATGGTSKNNAPHEVARPTRGQYAAEIALFSVFGILLILAIVALYTSMSPAYQRVPNLVDQGLKQLQGLKDLRQICLSGTSVTDVGVREMQHIWPRIQVIR